MEGGQLKGRARHPTTTNCSELHGRNPISSWLDTLKKFSELLVQKFSLALWMLVKIYYNKLFCWTCLAPFMFERELGTALGLIIKLVRPDHY